MDLDLPEELQLLQKTVRTFVEQTLAPHEKEIEEKDEISRTLISAMGRAGLFGIGHDERWGGQGFGKLGYAVAVEQDRKSTRLNSSHSQISYAVFCLKKKKFTTRRSRP